jgi:multidrug efflux pump subunit AcrA (membrane-fusion protein)
MNAKFGLAFCVSVALLSAACSNRSDSTATRNSPQAEDSMETKSSAETGAVVAADSLRRDTVVLSDESMKHVVIESIPVARGNLPMVLRTPGRISVNVNRTAKVTSTFEGRIAIMNYDVGTIVQPGDVMCLIDSPELLNRPLELKAPIGGQIIERHGTVGEAVDKTTELYTISDLKMVWCIAEVKEKDVAVVRTGQSASIRVLAYPRRFFAGTVLLSGQEVEERTRTLEVRIEVDNRDGALKPGMFADVELVTSVLDNVLMIPDDALQTLEDKQIVFIAADHNEFIKRVVVVGREHAGQAEILDGVHEGERVVTKGSFILKSELLKGELGEE